MDGLSHSTRSRIDTIGDASNRALDSVSGDQGFETTSSAAYENLEADPFDPAKEYFVLHTHREILFGSRLLHFRNGLRLD